MIRFDLPLARLEQQFFSNQQFAEIKAPVLWIEPEDRVTVSLINEVLEWCDDVETDDQPRGLMIKRALVVDGSFGESINTPSMECGSPGPIWLKGTLGMDRLVV